MIECSLGALCIRDDVAFLWLETVDLESPSIDLILLTFRAVNATTSGGSKPLILGPTDDRDETDSLDMLIILVATIGNYQDLVVSILKCVKITPNLLYIFVNSKL